MTAFIELLAMAIVYVFVREFIRLSLEDKEGQG